MARPWPRALYIETSILRKLPIDIASAGFLQLKVFCRSSGVPVFTTQLCLDEFLWSQIGALEADISTARGAFDRLERCLSRRVERGSLGDKTIANQAAEGIVQRFQEQGVEILSNTAVDQTRLIEMSIRKIPPFTLKGEKGFRDAIILFTIIEHARRTSRVGHYSLLLTDDKAIKDALEVLPECKDLEVIAISSIPEAIEHLKEFLIDAARTLYDYRVKTLIEFLNQNRDKIETFVREEASFPNDSLRGPELSPFDTIVEIRSIDLTDIQNAVPGALGNETKKRTVRISFDANVRLTLVVARALYPPVRKLRLKGEERLRGLLDPEPGLPRLFSREPFPQEVSIEQAVAIQASAHLENPDGKDIYSDLVLENVSVPENPFSRLLRAPYSG